MNRLEIESIEHPDRVDSEGEPPKNVQPITLTKELGGRTWADTLRCFSHNVQDEEEVSDINYYETPVVKRILGRMKKQYSFAIPSHKTLLTQSIIFTHRLLEHRGLFEFEDESELGLEHFKQAYEIQLYQYDGTPVDDTIINATPPDYSVGLDYSIKNAKRTHVKLTASVLNGFHQLSWIYGLADHQQTITQALQLSQAAIVAESKGLFVADKPFFNVNVLTSTGNSS